MIESNCTFIHKYHIVQSVIYSSAHTMTNAFARNNCDCKFPTVESKLKVQLYNSFKESVMAGDHAIMRYGDTKDVGQALGKFQQLQLSNQDFLSVSFTWRYFGKANLSCNQRSACFVLLESAIKVKSCQVRCCYKCFTTEISPTNCLSSCEYTLLETVAQCSNTFETAVCAIASASQFQEP